MLIKRSEKYIEKIKTTISITMTNVILFLLAKSPDDNKKALLHKLSIVLKYLYLLACSTRFLIKF